MAGYSGTPLAKKLGLKAGARVLLLGAPAGFIETLEDLPEGVTFTTRAGGAIDVSVIFAKTETELARRFDAARKALKQEGGLWVCWPKKSSGVATSLGFNLVQPYGLAQGLVDNKVCAVDEVWTGLRFVVRLRDRTR